MAIVRKRAWTSPKGEAKTAWIVDYTDGAGTRRYKQFAQKKAADAYLATVITELQGGVHIAASKGITVKSAADNWIKRARRENLEPATIDSYEQHVRLHIEPFLAERKLSSLTKPEIETFRDQLLENGRSHDMASRVVRSLSGIISEAERLGQASRNVAKGVRVRNAKRHKTRPVIPTKGELARLVNAAETVRHGDKAMMMILIFAGLRASELRALQWRHIDLHAKTIEIDQRADRKNIIGPPKSASGYRTIPIPDQLVSELRRWRLRCPPSDLDLVFPSAAGTPQFHANIVSRFLHPVQIAAGITRQKKVRGVPQFDDDGAPVIEGIYTLHCYRHAAASLWIDQRAEPKQVQKWMGHHSIVVTYDTYGHLFPDADDVSALLTRAASRLLSS